jgi:hypothetical protein
VVPGGTDTFLPSIVSSMTALKLASGHQQ